MDSENTLLYGMIILLIIVIITLITLLWHAGLFTEIIVKTCKPYLRNVTIAYKFAKGPYNDSGALFTEAHTLLPEYRTLGVYYDDPKKRDSSRLRYIVGLIISENGSPVKKEDETLLQERGYKFISFPEINHAVQTTFPFTSTISIIVGVFRVYPILDEYIKTRSLCVHPIMEVCDSENNLTYFIGPLEKQDDFYVPEVIEDTEMEQQSLIEDDEKSNLTWEDSASYIRAEVGDSETTGDENSLSADTSEFPINTCSQEEDSSTVPPLVKAVLSNLKEPKECTDDDSSDNNTTSSFEEIDEKEVVVEPKCLPEETK